MAALLLATMWSVFVTLEEARRERTLGAIRRNTVGSVKTQRIDRGASPPPPLVIMQLWFHPNHNSMITAVVGRRWWGVCGGVGQPAKGSVSMTSTSTLLPLGALNDTTSPLCLPLIAAPSGDFSE